MIHPAGARTGMGLGGLWPTVSGAYGRTEHNGGEGGVSEGSTRAPVLVVRPPPGGYESEGPGISRVCDSTACRTGRKGTQSQVAEGRRGVDREARECRQVSQEGSSTAAASERGAGGEGLASSSCRQHARVGR